MGRNRSQNETGTAPYNFVPLNKRIVRAVNRATHLPDHDTFIDDKGKYAYHGYIDVELETLSPTYIRAPQTAEQLANDNFVASDFFHRGDPDKPVIPGSSLRGMVRSLLEIVTYGKLRSVTEKKLFFRTVDNSVIGRAYRDRMVGKESGEKKVETGFLRYNDQKGCYQIVVCDMVRVDRHALPNDYLEGGQRNPNATPNWKYQNKLVGVHLSSNGYSVDSVDISGRSGRPGVLVMSGNVPRKKKEFIFFPPVSNAEVIDIPDDILERFHDDDQITQWQEKAFPVDQPNERARERKGLLQSNPDDPGDPVFFLREETRHNTDPQLSFFGRAQMFRLPYLNSPYNLLPPEHRYAAFYDVKRDRTLEFIDFAEAMFGYIREDEDFAYADAAPIERPKQGDKQRAYAGRVTVSDAVSDGNVTFYAGRKEVTPKILSSPKPTSFQKYLEQNTNNPRRMQHYDSDDATLRGHKLYWHQGSNPDFVETDEPDDSKVHTKMKPIATGNRFQFRIHFNALSATELGALLWVLTLPGEQNKTYAHKIGMGKALGLGSVKLTPSLHLIDRDGSISEGGIGRYHRLFAQDKSGNVRWHEAKNDYTDLIHGVAADFEQYMLKKLKSDKQRLRDVDRIADLLALMQWRGDLSPQDQQKIEDEGYEKGRRRLPTPREVFPN